MSTTVSSAKSQTASPVYDDRNPSAEGNRAQLSLPNQLSDAFRLPHKLTHEQCGHIRHIHNLASQIEGDWAFMGTQEPGQEYDTAFRYQLAHMAYAIGAAHYHHLPAQRSMFKTLFEKLIKKMLHKTVWDYWYLSSQSGIRLDPDLRKLRKPWADPVCKENIMVGPLPDRFKMSGLQLTLWIVFRPSVMHDLTLYDAVPRP